MIHKELANGKWQAFSFMFQMGNIGSEVSRIAVSKKAVGRALELVDLTIEDPKNIKRLEELRQLRNALAHGETFQCTAQQWTDYFYPFAYAAAIERNL